MRKTYFFYIILCIILLIIVAVDIANASADTTVNNICKFTNYLPVNRQRVVDPNIIGFDKNNNLLVASNWSNCGVSCYNGTTWTYWDKTTGLKTDQIHTLFNDREGNTWVTTSSGVSVYNGSTIRNIDVDGQSVYSICEDKNGIIWFFTGIYTAYKYSGDTISKAEFPIYEYVKSATYDKDSNMWLATSSGIWQYDGKSWTSYTTEHGLYQNNIKLVTTVHDSVFCLYDYGTAADSISKFDGAKWVRFPSPASNNIYGLVNIIEDNNHDLWLLASGLEDLFRYSGGEWKSISIGNYVPVYWLKSIGADKNGTVYFGNQLGRLAKYRNGIFTLIENSLYKGIGFVDPESPLVDKKNNLWVIPSTAMGASRFDGKSWTYFAQDSLTDIWWNNEVAGTAMDTFGNVYTGGPSLARFDGNKWHNYGYDIIFKYGLNWNTNFMNIFFDRSNSLWYSGSQTIVRVNNDGIKEFTNSDSILNLTVGKIFQDKQDNIWVLYQYSNRVSRFNGTKWENIDIPISYISDAASDTAGNIWFVGKGVAVYNKSGEFKIYNSLNSNLFEFDLGKVISDNFGRIFITYSWTNKIAIFVNNTFKNFTFNDYENLSATGIVLNKNGEVYITSTNHGLLRLDFKLETPEISKSDILCVGADNGKILIHPNDNKYLYTIDGVNYKADTIYDNLKKGNYTILAKSNKCYSSPVPIIINQPAGSFDVSLSDATCNGLKDGSIKITTSGLDSIRFKWSNGKDTSCNENIGKGDYSVTVTFKNNCNFTKTYSIKEPDVLTLYADFLNSCGNKGEIGVKINGGTQPYKIKWSTNDTVNLIKNLSAGDYELSITDAAKCTLDSTFIIKTFDEISSDRMLEKAKDYLCSENVKISTIDTFVSYKWFRNDTALNLNTNSITVNTPGIYSVDVIDSNHCFGQDSIKMISRRVYSTPQICLVTVDNSSNKNKILWNKIPSDSLAVINILKESDQVNKYENIGTIYAYNDGIFMDTASDPDAKADVYRISLTDECGTISDSSVIHKTIHLESSVGNNGEINLSWNGYEGFSFDSYNLYRKSDNSDFELLTTVKSNLNSYTDANPPVNKVLYQIEAINPDNCNPSESENYSRSNIISRDVVNSIDYKTSDFIKVSPNPAQDYFTISLERKANKPYSLKISDISGRIVIQKEINENSINIERGNLPSGLYMITIEGEINFNTKVLLK